MARPAVAVAAPPSRAAHFPGYPACEDSVMLMGRDEAVICTPTALRLPQMRCLPRAKGFAPRDLGLQALGLLVWLCRCAGRQQGVCPLAVVRLCASALMTAACTCANHNCFNMAPA